MSSPNSVAQRSVHDRLWSLWLFTTAEIKDGIPTTEPDAVLTTEADPALTTEADPALTTEADAALMETGGAATTGEVATAQKEEEAAGTGDSCSPLAQICDIQAAVATFVRRQLFTTSVVRLT